MMQKGKLLRRSLFVAVAAASLTATTSEVKATQGDDTAPKGTFDAAGLESVTVDASKALLEVTAKDGAKEILVGTGKAKIKKGETTGTITVSAWDVYGEDEFENGKTVKVDLSKLKNTADNYLVLQTNMKDDIAIVKIPVAAKYAKVKFDAANAKLLAGASNESSKAATPDSLETPAAGEGAATGVKELADRIQYRTTYSERWEDIVIEKNNAKSVMDFKLYQKNGTQLYVRLKAGALSTEMEQKGETLTYGSGNDAKVAQAYLAPNLPGKEMKVTISAQAKGPSITADFTNGTVKIPKKSEYRFFYGPTMNDLWPDRKADAAVGADGCKYEYKDADGTAMLTDKIFELKDPTSEPGSTTTKVFQKGILEVRKAATAKKVASKWSRLKIQTLESMDSYITIEDKDKIENIKSARETATTGKTKHDAGGLINSKVYAALNEDGSKKGEPVLKINYTKSKSTMDVCDSFEIKNESDNEYEIYVAAPDSGDAGNPNKITTKISKTKVAKKGKKVEKGKTVLSPVYIRKTGNKKTQTWATDWGLLGYIDYEILAPTTTPENPPT